MKGKTMRIAVAACLCFGTVSQADEAKIKNLLVK